MAFYKVVFCLSPHTESHDRILPWLSVYAVIMDGASNNVSANRILVEK